MTESQFGVHRDLSAALRRQARRTGERTPSVRGSDWRLATVATVNSDGTIVTSDGVIARRLQSYQAPAVNDVIKISQSSSGNWLAEGRTAATGVGPVMQNGAAAISFTSLDTYSGTTVTFPVAFTAVPRVFVNIDSGGASTARWQARAINVTTTGFVPFVFSSTAGATATWSAVNVNWFAIHPSA
ncbi:H-type lectin domain-containing protein [Streptomyces rishiriensis]|uniref:H-type lectin domain-containing protein n=1 Tax=Streptomyces rishiriensis TaxID=68264 RepID=UPI000D59B69F|nr:H-type lectin domain-containing protein [Streptomyces rishiriensis]